MGKILDHLDPPTRAFLEAQTHFFVATAPGGAEGHVNLSPKGFDSFRILDDRTVAYLDAMGSGAETIAHLRDNGRITLLFCAYAGAPKIVRLYGRGRAVEPIDEGFADLVARFAPREAGDALGRVPPRSTRSVIVVTLERVAHSCGYGVPRMRYEGSRDQLQRWGDKKSDDELRRYRAENNAVSIDGLPALRDVE